MSTTIPTNSADLEAILSDPKRIEQIHKDGQFGEFIRNYANATHKADVDLSAQIKEQTQAALADMLKMNKQDAAKLNLAPGVGGKVARGGKGEVYNRRAPGAGVDSEAKYEDAAEFFQSIWQNVDSLPNSEALKEKAGIARKVKNSFGSTVPADGGFLIPETLRSDLLKWSLESSVVRPRATVIPMDSLRVPIPMVDSTSNVGSVFGGIVAYWTEESAALTESQASFGRVVLDAKKLTAYAVVPNELIADSTAFMGFFDQAFPQAISFYEDAAFMAGTGVGEPEGYLNNPATVTVAGVAGQGANTIIWENIVAMYARMLPGSLGNAVWIVSPDVFPQLATMALSVGTGGSAIWLQNGSESPNLTLLGRPVIVSEKVPALGTTGDIAFVDLSYYLIGDRQAMQAASSSDYRFGNDQTAFRIIERVDGRPWLQSAITPKNGGPTLSPFVQLSSTRT